MGAFFRMFGAEYKQTDLDCSVAIDTGAVRVVLLLMISNKQLKKKMINGMMMQRSKERVFIGFDWLGLDKKM